MSHDSSAQLRCWKCSAGLDDLPRPLGRRAECPACGAELHVCRQCRHFDSAKAKHCRERAADEEKNKTRANFCEWFQPQAGLAAGSAASQGGRSALEALFDNTPAPAKNSRSDLDALFGPE